MIELETLKPIKNPIIHDDCEPRDFSEIDIARDILFVMNSLMLQLKKGRRKGVTSWNQQSKKCHRLNASNLNI
uniref:Uncharacterized protein n=1 Tax=Tetranychus urticae TaxID=32264 RepID=T1KWV7_TETUR